MLLSIALAITIAAGIALGVQFRRRLVAVCVRLERLEANGEHDATTRAEDRETQTLRVEEILSSLATRIRTAEQGWTERIEVLENTISARLINMDAIREDSEDRRDQTLIDSRLQEFERRITEIAQQLDALSIQINNVPRSGVFEDLEQKLNEVSARFDGAEASLTQYRSIEDHIATLQSKISEIETTAASHASAQADLRTDVQREKSSLSSRVDAFERELRQFAERLQGQTETSGLASQPATAPHKSTEKAGRIGDVSDTRAASLDNTIALPDRVVTILNS
ncbi:MAG: hypothetical protein ACFB03_09865 [Paracoccaceae bacterium]